MIRFSGFVFLCFFILLPPVSLLASTARNVSDPVPVNVLFERLEQKYSVIIFYQEDWFRGKTYPTQLVDLPLEEAVSKVISGLNLSATYLDGYVAIVPVAADQGSMGAVTGERIIIGNPLLMGSQRFATVSGSIMDGNTGEPLFGR
jgi:ABC-type sulfate transport system permease subunit